MINALEKHLVIMMQDITDDYTVHTQKTLYKKYRDDVRVWHAARNIQERVSEKLIDTNAAA